MEENTTFTIDNQKAIFNNQLLKNCPDIKKDNLKINQQGKLELKKNKLGIKNVDKYIIKNVFNSLSEDDKKLIGNIDGWELSK